MGIWTLPGPDRFLQRVILDLDEGGVVVVRLPSTFKADDVWAEVVRREPYRRVAHIDMADLNERTLIGDAIGQQAGLEGVGWTAADIAAESELEGQVLCLVGVELSDQLQRWRSWLREFTAASGAVGPDRQPPVFLLLITGPAGDAHPQEGPRARAHWWWDVVDHLDVAVYLRDVAGELDRTDREQIIEVGGGDLDLVERLAVERCREPEPILRICRERRDELGIAASTERQGAFGPTPGSCETAWAEGAINLFDGRPFWHAGLLAEDAHGLDRRLWVAQIRALLPQIDIWRMELIELARRHRLVPGHLLTVELEVKDLSRLLARSGEHHVGEFAEWLRRSRNQLAHLESLPAATRDRGAELAQRAGLEV